MSKLKFATLNTLNHVDSVEQRFPVICDNIEKCQFDVIAFQELVLEKAEFYEAELEKIGYKLVMNQHTQTAKGVWRNIAPPNNVGVAYNASTVRFSSMKELNFHGLVGDFEFLPTSEIVTVFSYHGHWGGNLRKRLNEVVKISKISANIRRANPNRIIILAGDFNSVPEEEAIQYLRGNRLYRGKSTYWTDWHMVQDKVIKTVKNYGENAIRTAKHVDITNIEMMPMRTIDYIMTYGWNFGKRGGFADRGGIWADQKEPDLSDHLGLWADIQL
jgi:exonuclease III